MQAPAPPLLPLLRSRLQAELLTLVLLTPRAGVVADRAGRQAPAESVIGLFTTELIKQGGPWRNAKQVEIATLDYVDWLNRRRLYEACATYRRRS
jgi:putative transposase